MNTQDKKDAAWPKPWRLRWWPRDASERELPSHIDTYHDTKAEAESNAPLAPWEVKHESECNACGRNDAPTVTVTSEDTVRDCGVAGCTSVATAGSDYCTFCRETSTEATLYDTTCVKCRRPIKAKSLVAYCEPCYKSLDVEVPGW